MLDLWSSPFQGAMPKRLLENTKCVVLKWRVPDKLIELSKLILRKTINKVVL